MPLRSFGRTLVALVCLALAACTVAPERPDDVPAPDAGAPAAPGAVPSAPGAAPESSPAPAAGVTAAPPSAVPSASPPASPPSSAPSSPPVATTPPAAPAPASPPPIARAEEQALPPKPRPAAPPSPLERELGALVHHVVNEGVVVVLGGDSLAASGPLRLAPDAMATLDRVVAVLKRDAVRRAAIVAYHETPGSRDYNIALSERRANVVRQYLVEQGVRPHRIAVRPYGDVRASRSPLEDVADPGRRVEIVIGRMPNAPRR